MSKAILAAIGLLPWLFAPSQAQLGPATSGNPNAPGIAGEAPKGVATISDQAVDQINKFGTYDALKARMKKWNKEGKSAGEILAEDKAKAAALVASFKLQCRVTNAILVAVDDNANTKTYEVACDSGVGYFLVQGGAPGGSSGFTCFAAEAARAVDIAAKREPAIACGLPENPGSKAAAASILSQAGKACTIKDIKWRGQSPTTDFIETACAEGPGFTIWSPLPGSQAPVRIMACPISEMNGVACRLRDNDTALAAAKAALGRYKVSCDAQSVRVIGHETVKRRQVVEYFCPSQQPKGLVAYLPAEGSNEPFEAVDCLAAAKRQAVCTLTKPN
ncbi:hypothetical protein [Rhizomicrobium electricum]|uniref:Uncharacterized protein n=1 Tax=Rhizomicrobium electricum TaxID=480070 RepID=A0ABN1FCF5_9PROT|nr:hypothetical protein [Rhizomicrobium electricum]NIJ50753.1 hypothetical protein [Rhizomicrobium electricum]